VSRCWALRERKLILSANVRTGVQRLAPYTTLRVGGPAPQLITVDTEADLIEQVRDADAEGQPVRVLGGGSNVLIGDDGVDGTVVRVATQGISADVSGCSGAVVTAAAGENWDELVTRAVDEEWGGGIECLAGIPGLVGATPIQNVGAYGSDVSQVISSVRTWDRVRNRQATFAAADCGFSFRTSTFKQNPDRYLILSVTFQFPPASLSAPIRYAELARTLGTSLGVRTPAAEVQRAVLSLRRAKGMVLDDDDPDTWSAGSFFLNPILPADRAAALPAEAPRFAADGDRVKTSAAWLIEHSGFGKGYGRPPATLSTKHALAITNRGGATAGELIALAREIRAGVSERFGIILEPEPVLWGCQL
jgi:UDP-N-acetylmuramate dehydrogenase